MEPQKNRRFIFSIIGIVFFFLGILQFIFSEKIINKMMEMNMVLSPNSTIFDFWKTPPVKLTLDIYIFNWTNPEDFQNLNIKPKFEELGPYRFIDVPDKVDIKWHPENASITYRKQNKYQFDAEYSRGTLDDNIVTLNALAVAVAAKAKYWSTLRRKVADIALRVYRNDVFIKKSVDELLFGGYEDVLLNIANILPSTFTNVAVPFDKIGYCYPRNNSAELTGTFNIHTGADDIRNLGKIHTWNYRNITDHYPRQCSQVQGSPGELQPPYLEKYQPAHYFLSDFCRTVQMDYVDTVNVEGFEAYRYEPGKRLMDNGTLYPENECYCSGQCVPSGAVNVSSCWFGLPLFFSYPHFYDADPYYLEQIEGMNPQKDKHELYMVLDKKTGLNLEFSARLQANILVEPVEDFSIFKNQRRVFMPLAWFDESTRITPALADMLKILPRLLLFSQICAVVWFLFGIILLAWKPVRERWNIRLVQHIKINELMQEEKQIKGQSIKISPEISPLLRRMQITVSLLPKSVSLESADTSSSMDTQRDSESSINSDSIEPVLDNSFT